MADDDDLPVCPAVTACSAATRARSQASSRRVGLTAGNGIRGSCRPCPRGCYERAHTDDRLDATTSPSELSAILVLNLCKEGKQVHGQQQDEK